MSNRRMMLFAFGGNLRFTIINNRASQTMTVTANGASFTGSNVPAGQTTTISVLPSHTTVGIFPSSGSTQSKVNGVQSQNFTLWNRNGSATTVPVPADFVWTCTDL